MTRALLIMLACAACGDPGLRCPQGPGGTAVGYGTACVFPANAIAIDGELADWAAIPSDNEPCTGCRAAEVIAVHATRTTDDRLALYLETMGAPLADADHRYVAVLAPLAGPLYAFTIQSASTSTSAALGSIDVAGLPIEAAFGASGIELALALDALPFTAGLQVDRAELQDQLGLEWSSAQAVVPTIVYVCWDASSPLCQPL